MCFILYVSYYCIFTYDESVGSQMTNTIKYYSVKEKGKDTYVHFFVKHEMFSSTGNNKKQKDISFKEHKYSLKSMNYVALNKFFSANWYLKHFNALSIFLLFFLRRTF